MTKTARTWMISRRAEPPNVETAAIASSAVPDERCRNMGLDNMHSTYLSRSCQGTFEILLKYYVYCIPGLPSNTRPDYRPRTRDIRLHILTCLESRIGQCHCPTFPDEIDSVSFVRTNPYVQCTIRHEVPFCHFKFDPPPGSYKLRYNQLSAAEYGRMSGH